MFACGGGLVTWLAIPVILRRLSFLKRNGVSQPHHTQKRERARLGGLAMVISFLIISLAVSFWFPGDAAQAQTRWVIVCSAAAMFLLGFWDDLKPLGARKKLIGQILIALAAWFAGIHIEAFKNPLTGSTYQLGFFGGCALTVFWLIALPNLINLVDGMDGLAGGISLMLMGLLCYAGLTGSAAFPALCAAGMVGALIGFLRFNFPPASIFMGDGGAYFLGLLMAELSIINSHKGTIAAALLAPLFVLALPIADVSLAILRRGLRGIPIFRPDRRHIHHRLLGIGYTPRRAVLTLYFLSLIFLVLGLVVFLSQGRWAAALFGVGCLVFILSARCFSFSREWFSVGRVLGNSIEMRENIQYALTMSRWLEMEAARCGSLESLWLDFEFLVMKLNFSHVKLVLPDGLKEWRKKRDGRFQPAQMRRFSRELCENGCMLLELEMDAEENLFSNLCDITCEAWLKAATRWAAINGLPVGFRAHKYSSRSLDHHRKGERPHVPIPRDWTPA
jgi:UDP-GlcNAc:undecaprenyl-phosphate GlcNAc-1-phosphate transferase